MRSTQDRMKIYEDEVLLGMARSLIPIEKFEAAASGEDQQGQILLELLSWFKSEFFRWFNPPKCRKCPDDQQTESCGKPQLILFFNS